MTGRVRADRCSLGSTSRVIHMVIICDRIEYIASHVRRASCRTEFEYTVFFCIRRVFVAENRVMTLRLEPELRKRLDGLAKAQRRSRSFIAAEAIRQYVAVNEWQIEEISKGMAEADRGEFASDEQVRHTMNKWTGRKPTRRAK